MPSPLESRSGPFGTEAGPGRITGIGNGKKEKNGKDKKEKRRGKKSPL
jgi:hypothetical protein